MAGREVTSRDAPALEAFRCAHPDREWEYEVEAAIRDSLFWISGRSGRFVRVFMDDGDLAVVIAYEYVDPSSVEEGFYIPFLGVTCQLQGDGYGVEALDALMCTLREESFGGAVTCRIDTRNRHSQRFFSARGFVLVEIGSESSEYQLWRTSS